MAESFDWSKYEDAPATKADEGFDWSKYEDSEEAPADEILNERANQVSFKDRAIAKNLAQSTEKQAAYLKQQYPNLDIKLSGSDILIRGAQGEPYRKLDPSGFDIEDLTDIGDVVGAGLASTGGMLAGGLGGSMVGPGGTVAGALAGTTAAGSGYEALRQKLGQKLGIPQDVSASDVAMAGAGNLAGGALLGTGPLLSSAGKGLAKSAGYDGLMREGWNKGMPAMARFWTGVSDDVLKAYTNPATREEIKTLASGGKTEFTDNLVNQIRAGLNKEKKAVGQQLSSSIDNAGQMVNLRSAKEAIDAQVKSAKEAFDAVPNQLNKDKLDDAIKAYQSLFEGPNGQAIADELPASQAFQMQGDLKDFADLRRVSGGINSRYASNATQAEKELSNASLDSYNAIGKELSRVTEGQSPMLKKQYGELLDLQSTLAPSLKSDQSAYSTFTNLDGKSKVMFKEALEKLGAKTGENYADPITKLQAADYFGSNSWTPKSIGGTTSTSRTLPGVLAGGLVGATIGSKLGPMGGVAGGVIGSAAGGASASPNALKYLIEATDPLRAGASAISPYYTPMVPVLREGVVQSPWMDMGR